MIIYSIISLLKSCYKFSRTVIFIFPSSTIKLCSLAISSLARRKHPWAWLPSFMRTCNLFSAKISWNWVNSSLVHVVLINLYWVPIVKIAFSVSIGNGKCTATHIWWSRKQMLSIVMLKLWPTSASCGHILTLFDRFIISNVLSKVRNRDFWILLNEAGILFFFKQLILFREFEYFQILLIISLIWLF